jgi:hypothetical protein
MNTDELKTILAAHREWVESGYTKGARAYLTGADLTGADLTGANLTGAYLTGANLTGAYLTGADLTGAYLRGANLTGADLRGAYLRGADLRGAYLRGADLRGAYLRGAELSPFQIVPEVGAFIGFKRLRYEVICKLEIPADAKRTSSLVGRKCRAEFVRVLEGEGVDTYTGETAYKVGEIVRPDSYDDDIRVECSHGIHFFITKKEAEDYL